MTTAKIQILNKENQVILNIIRSNDGNISSLGSLLYSLFKDTKISNEYKPNKFKTDVFSSIGEFASFLNWILFNDMAGFVKIEDVKNIKAEYLYIISINKTNELFVEVLNKTNEILIEKSKFSEMNKKHKDIELYNFDIIKEQNKSNEMLKHMSDLIDLKSNNMNIF